jgi:hypothetical protein
MNPLPSSDSARDMINGEPGAALRVLGHMAGRAALMGTGMMIAGIPWRTTLKASLAATVTIEAFALLWFGAQKK